MKRLLTALFTLLSLLPAAATAAAADAPARDVLFVGNNWDGTADVIDPHAFKRLARINIVPDLQERLAEIQASPDRQAYFLAIRQEVGEGHDQLVDDMFSSPDGSVLYVSRPSLADVVAIDLRTRGIAWRVPVDGYRADHMAISPDGRRLLVSASTARKVHVIDTQQGKIVGEFASGDQPHENNFSKDGSTIYHASIGTVYTPLDAPQLDATKGDRWFEIVDAKTLKVRKKLVMGQKLAEAGYPSMSSAVRPMALSPDERFVYFQVSFFHGFVEYDLEHDRVTRLARLPLSEKAAGMRREDYLLDSAHHGLSMNPEGTKLCAAGTMSDYAAIVHRRTFSYRVVDVGQKPYWSTNSGDGKYCFVSASGDDLVSVVSYADEELVARIPVGDHPQRMRMGTLRDGFLGVPAAARGSAGQQAGARGTLRVSVVPRRVRAGLPVSVRVRVTTRRGTASVPVAGATVRLAGVTARTDRRGIAVVHKRRGFARAGRPVVRVARSGYRAATTRLSVRR